MSPRAIPTRSARCSDESRGATIWRIICSAAAPIFYGAGARRKSWSDGGHDACFDLATGSGDLALAIQRRLPEATIIAADFSPEMLEVARAKGVRETVLADAMHLPFEAGSFDCVTVAFGLRNMSDWNLALSEMARVLRKDGHLLVLDFSLPVGALRPAYRFYLHRCLPFLASLVTGQKAAYDYLGGSIEKFPSGEEMIRLIEESGFVNATTQPLTGGIATIYTAQTLRAL